jgi:hypothetical protein
MAAMKGTILPLKRNTKHKRRKHGAQGETELQSDDESIDIFDGIEKVHQDDDFSKYNFLNSVRVMCE